MKKFLIVTMILLAGFIVFASTEIGVGLDGLFVQDFIISKTAIQPAIDIRMPLTDSYELRLPVTMSISKSSMFLDTGLYAVCHPYKGLFFGLSMIQIGIYLKSSQSEKQTIALNEIMAGWTFELNNGIYIEPQIIMRDPSYTYQDEYESLRGLFPCYSTIRIRCIAGYSFTIGGRNEKEN